MEQITTAKLHLTSTLHDPSEAEVRAAGEQLAQLDAEARALGAVPKAAPVHYAMGRIWIERLGDPRSAAVCYQNAFALDPRYRPNVEAARRLFGSEGAWERALALHRHEEQLIADPVAKTESLRAQAWILSQPLGRAQEAVELVQRALTLSPDHPALLKAAVEAAAAGGDRLGVARLLLRSAAALKDDVQRSVLLRRAVLLLEELHGDAVTAHAKRPPLAGTPHRPAPTPGELAALLEEATRKLHAADPDDPVGAFGLLTRARATGAWDEVLRLSRQHSDRTAGAEARLLVAQIALHKLGRPSEALAEVQAGLAESPQDAELHALHTDLLAAHRPQDLPAALVARAGVASDAGERAACKLFAAQLTGDPLARERLLSEALAENPGDAAAIALHARLVAARDAGAAAERFAALGAALEEHAPTEAALHTLEAAACLERIGRRAEAAELGARVLALSPQHPAALRLLQRTLPFVGGSMRLARVLEDAAENAPPAAAAELLARAAALLSDQPAPAELAEDAPDADSASTETAEVPPQARALDLMQRAAELTRGATGPRWMEAWTTLALRMGDLPALSRVLEARAELAHGAEGAELLVEAAELARAAGGDARAAALLRRARQMDLGCTQARRLLLALPRLPAMERLDLLAEEARGEPPERAAALQAERAALFEEEGRIDDAVQACALALSLGGVDVAVLRRLMRLQQRRGDLSAALAVLLQLASAQGEGRGRAEAYTRAGELCEWRLLDLPRALELYRLAAEAWPEATLPRAALARIHAWEGRFVEAAAAYEELARAAKKREKVSALRRAASLRANRTGEPGKAAELYRALLAEEPGDLPSMAALLQVTRGDFGPEGRRERAELRGKLASYCQDPRMAALLRAESAEDRLAGGERDQGIAEYRRALALNPHDRVALDLVEEALRASGERQLLAEHLAFRCAYEDAETRSALALQQAELFAEDGNLEKAAAAYRQALANDPGSLLATRGARGIAERSGDKQEVLRLLAKEAGLAHDEGQAAGSLVEAALLAEDLGDHEEAVQHLSLVLERDPENELVARRLRKVLGGSAAEMVSVYERIGESHPEARLGAVAWIAAGQLQLDELRDPQAAFVSAGKAQALDADSHPALELRADAAEAAGRYGEAADALARRLARPADEVRRASFRLRLGRLYAERLGDAKRALPLLADRLDALPLEVLMRLAPAASALPPRESVRLHRKLLDAFPEPAPSGAPTRMQIAAWTDELARGALSLGDRKEALVAFRRAYQLEPRNRGALEHVAELAAEEFPQEAVGALRRLLELPGARPELLRALSLALARAGDAEGAFCAAASLVGLGAASAAEKAAHDAISAKPPPAELPLLGEARELLGEGDGGLVREFLAAAAPELARALPTELAGRGDRVKGDNPVRRICSAIGRALGLSQEPALYLAKGEPSVVLPAATDPAGLLVGAEVPRRYTPRQQRFLYARALAHLRAGTHMLVELPPRRLLQLAAELSRVCSPPGTDNEKLLPADEALAETLSAALSPEARHRLSPLALRVAHEGLGSAETLALGLRETAERTALVICGDPAAALVVVARECPGGLERPEVARLVRFAVSETFFKLRAR